MATCTTYIMVAAPVMNCPGLSCEPASSEAMLFILLTSLATVALLPLIHLDSLIIENNYGKGMMMFLVTMLLYPLLVIV